ncbi:UbiX family flavin prenyltransferase [Cryobacterium sp. Hh7]|uniref:UbiX family flavin prenyltransferase n=1 Tax=Cryobacterium sp. Hh7 TaxID=1259159 RepID=UPI0018E0706B|nr:UbiX family flavin prenyltransferase [Cryobacterium sp. Hh7]
MTAKYGTGNPRPRTPWVVGVTGASGIPYSTSVLRGLIDAGESVDLVVSKAGRLTMIDELGFAVRDSHWREDVTHWLQRDLASVCYWSPGNFAAGPASGSYRTRGMIVVPATSSVVAGIALGTSKDLIQRAGDVTLKERRPLVLVVREMPLRAATLDHMANLAREGAVIMPASPAFYAGSTSVAQLVDFVAGRVLDQCGVDHDLYQRWSGVLGDATQLTSLDHG